MPQDLTDDKSTLVQVMAWCRKATSHYLSQCWPSSVLPYGVIRPEWVNSNLSIYSIPAGIHLTAISQQVPKVLFRLMSLKIILLKLLPHLPGVNELTLPARGQKCTLGIYLIHKSQNAPVPYPTMFHSERFCSESEWSIMGYGTGAFWDLWNWSIRSIPWQLNARRLVITRHFNCVI